MIPDPIQLNPSSGGAESNPRGQTILAIDHGEKRIGLSIKPAGQLTALPLKVIQGQPVDDAMSALRGLIAERNINLVLIGLPVHSDSTQAKRVKRFARRLRQGIQGVRWRFVDESLTSESSAGIARRAGRKSSTPIDDLAATLILETYLQSLNRE